MSKDCYHLPDTCTLSMRPGGSPMKMEARLSWMSLSDCGTRPVHQVMQGWAHHNRAHRPLAGIRGRRGSPCMQAGWVIQRSGCASVCLEMDSSSRDTWRQHHGSSWKTRGEQPGQESSPLQPQQRCLQLLLPENHGWQKELQLMRILQQQWQQSDVAKAGRV